MQLKANLSRYFVRWRTEGGSRNSFTRLVGWDVVDNRGYVTLVSFPTSEEDKAQAVCKWLNRNEEFKDEDAKP